MSANETSSLGLPLRILFSAILTILLVWAMNALIPQYFSISGGWAAFVIVGCLVTLLNLIARPILHILTFPLKLFATLLALILSNAAFVWLVVRITSQMDPSLVQLRIADGFVSWMVVAAILGIANLFFKHTL